MLKPIQVPEISSQAIEEDVVMLDNNSFYASDTNLEILHPQKAHLCSMFELTLSWTSSQN